MSDTPKRTECGWVGPLPEVGSPRQCEACGLLRTFGDVKHKRCLQAKAESARRYDWFAESPCDHRQGPGPSLPCGCGGSGSVVVMVCLETAGARCVATTSQRSQLLKKHRELHETVRVCEYCPLRSTARTEIQTAEGAAPVPLVGQFVAHSSNATDGA